MKFLKVWSKWSNLLQPSFKSTHPVVHFFPPPPPSQQHTHTKHSLVVICYWNLSFIMQIILHSFPWVWAACCPVQCSGPLNSDILVKECCHSKGKKPYSSRLQKGHVGWGHSSASGLILQDVLRMRVDMESICQLLFRTIRKRDTVLLACFCSWFPYEIRCCGISFISSF